MVGLDAKEFISEYWMFLAPLILAQLILMVVSLAHIFRHDKYKFGNRLLWIAVVVLFQIIGPAVYFALGRGEDD